MRSRICAGAPPGNAVALALISVFLLAGCGTPPADSGASGGANSQSTSPSPAVAASGTTEAAPSPSASMVCGEETRSNIVRILALPSPPHTTDAWADKLYACTYALPAGSLVLSVKELADPAAAHVYFDGLQRGAASARPIEGMANLGLPAFETTGGSVVFVKDNFVLTVDATALPPTLGPHSVSRNAFAYEVATAVLACWSE
ncbi:hypothetical protein AB4089_22200 [Arthrobacter sp. 2MCAF15]|uniref:hypothetical protein n=1 Tax=Arthrobacter sp. 2MCAF15 TaxID=3232984 RepID=UPI003F90587B